ncbi:helix-turn-helix domain-containing protein [Halioxenophilus aromaticivorans]
MINTNNPITQHKACLLNLVGKLGNVAKAFNVIGVSRDTLYRYR